MQCMALYIPSFTGDCQVKRYMYTGAVPVVVLRFACFIESGLKFKSMSV